MNILYLTHFLNGFLMVAIPVALAFYLTRKFKLGWRLWWIGAATFILSQVGHIPFNAVFFGFLKKTLFLPQFETVLYAVLGGLSAGVFEEGARYLMYRFWAKDARSWGKGLLAGAGHGGAEAIIFGLLVLVNYVVLVVIRSMDLSTLIPAEELSLAQRQLNTYWSLPWYDTLLGAVERFFALPVQISLAVIVLQAFTRKQGWWVGVAVLWHALVDATAVFTMQVWQNTYLTEAIVGVMALLSVGAIFALRQPELPAEPETSPLPEPPPAPAILPVEETGENLEQARYD